MVKNDNLAPQKARLNFHQGILNSMLFNLFRPMPQSKVLGMLLRWYRKIEPKIDQIRE